AKIGYNRRHIITDMVIYQQNPAEIIALLRHVAAGEENVWLFGHNPSIRDLVSLITDLPAVKTPPGTVTAIAFELPDWTAALASIGKTIRREIP
ncbi:MAG: hypothetical protein PHQ27_01940, partial [Victivallales bacterium]|nr:hypothetical protein [Victivallales bacterium]